jgi:exodeoxyribonuclease III
VVALTICSWNVNGLRASLKAGDFQVWLADSTPDIVGLQEVKARPDQVDSAPWLDVGYHETWNPAEKAGYSGALLLAKTPPKSVSLGMGVEKFDHEGRMIEAEFEDITVITCYFPNGGRKLDRLDFKLAFYDAFLARVNELRAEGRQVVFMGDLNVAHHEVDIERPDENRKSTGFLEVERAWVDRLHEEGWVDTFRSLNPETTGAYTYWDAWRERRARNIGWRIDYVFADQSLMPRVTRAFIQSNIMSSDHCPVGIEIDL